MNQKVIEILEILNKCGSAHLVGGCVRDMFLEIEPHDYDIVSNVSMDKIEELFSTHSIGKNKDFGIVVVNYKGESFEISQCRVDGAYKNHKHPSEISIVDDVKLDVFRRDFSCNGLLMNSEETIIDYVGGLEDIKNKILRTIGNPYERFEEDSLRLLRCIRFSNRFDFTIEENTYKALCENSSKIQFIAKERIHQEICKMSNLGGKKFAKCIEQMSECGLLKYIYPEVENLKNFEHSKLTHPEGNVFKHTIEAVRCCESNDPYVLLSCLFHDNGKQLTHTYNKEKDKHQYIGHDFEGYKLIKDELAEKYCWSNDLKDIVAFCALEHMKFHNISNMKNSKILRLMNSKYWDILFQVAKSDSYSRGKDFGDIDWKKVTDKLNKLKENGLSIEYYKEVKSKINGDLIMRIKNINSGKAVKYYIEKTIDYVINHNISLDNDEIIFKYLKSLKYEERN